MNAIAQYFRNIADGVMTTFAGMRVTMKYLWSPVVTLQYPDEKMPMFERFRGLLHNRIEDCIGCGQCVRACPVDCITMVTQKAKDVDLGMTRDGTPKKLHVYQFDIDTITCMWCNLCTEVCPTECLTMSSEYEVSSSGRDSWVLRFAIDEPPAGFDLEGMRYKQNRVTNPVEYAGAADPGHLQLPDGLDRPTSGAGAHDYVKLRQAELAREAAAAKAAAKEAAAARAAAAKPAAAAAPGEAPAGGGEQSPAG